MRRWLSLATALVFLLCGNGVAGYLGEQYKKLEDCPENSTCLVFNFADAKCTLDGKEASAFVWKTEETTKVKCQYRDYGYTLARLDIVPLNLTNWQINIIVYEKYNDEQVNNLEDLTFKFRDAQLKFLAKNETQFLWNKKRGGSKQVDRPVDEKGDFTTKWQSFWDWFKVWSADRKLFNRYSFGIHTNGEKLLDFIGPEVTLEVKGGNHVVNDMDFPEQLSKLTKCDASEINEVCYGTCEKIFPDPKPNSNSTNSTGTTQDIREPNCPSHLWFHSPSDGAMFRQWKKVEGKLNCYMGWWRPNWTSWDADAPKGSQNLVRTDEVQCSVEKPSKLTTMAQIIFGVSGSILGLLVVAGVVAFVVCFLKRRNSRTHHRHGRTEKTDRKNTIRDSDSRAQTPGTPGGKSTEREKY